MIRIVEDERDVADAFVSLEGGELLNTVGRFLFSRHQDVTKLSKVQCMVCACVCACVPRQRVTGSDIVFALLTCKQILEDPVGGIDDVPALQRRLLELHFREQWRTEQEVCLRIDSRESTMLGYMVLVLILISVRKLSSQCL